MVLPLIKTQKFKLFFVDLQLFKQRKAMTVEILIKISSCNSALVYKVYVPKSKFYFLIQITQQIKPA